MFRRIKEYVKASVSGPGLVGWLVALFKPIARVLNMLGDVDLLGNYLGGFGRFLATGWGTLACVALGALIIGSAIIRKERELKTADHAIKDSWHLRKTLWEPKHLIVIGLAIICVGAVAVGVGLWRLPAKTDSQQAPAAPPSQTSQSHKPIYRVDEIEEMLGALRSMRKIVDENTAPHAWKTQEIYQQWPHLLMNDGPLAIAARLEAIRDPIRAAGISMNELMYKESHYDVELRPVLGDFQNAYGWFDSTTSMLIDALKKYAAADKALLSDLLKDRYQEWSRGINENVFQRIGKIDANITAKTKELREWPNLGERAQPDRQPLKRMLTAYDVEQRERAIDQILGLLDPKLMAISAEGEKLNQKIVGLIQDGAAVKTLDEYSEKARVGFTEYFQVIARFQQFPDIYNAAFASTWNPMDISTATDNLRAQIQQIEQASAMKTALPYLLDSKYMSDWKQITAGRTWTWINDHKNALIAKRREYEQAEVYSK